MRPREELTITPDPTPEKILLVGAGAVGQVYGRHLQRGGAEVTFLVKDRYAAECRAGLTMYPLNGNRRRTPVRFEGFGVLTTVEEVSAASWDQVWLCVPSPALHGAWLGELLPAVGDASVVLLTPGLDDKLRILSFCPEERLVQGLINMISYQAPLASETLPEPGIAYWFPPLSGSPFDGSEARTRPIVAMLKAGGCPASFSPKAIAGAPFATAVLMPLICALEAAGWSFEGVRRGSWLALAAAGSHQAMAVIARASGLKLPAMRHLIRPLVLRLVISLARFVIPLDIETYLRYHFSKVGDQTRIYIHRYLETGAEYGLDTDALGELSEAIGPPTPSPRH